ncbi:oxidoreductase [Occultella glacieicola]|uniref:Oxidoreductase n=1 Tax=Occultella glacieicola TaxID=2518684 RepID=A0ABY2DXN6_9MICO|nr:molybdopterin-dependent oxidoreductase [Occultella glacieicola]TDE88894.1 oxidoreductase [Occultella glacieicola]
MGVTTISPTAPATARRSAGVAGVLAAALTLTVGHLVAAIVDPDASPFIALGGAVVDATPAWLKDFAASTFGTADKTVLFVCMAAVVLGLAYGVGRLALTRPTAAAVCVVVLAGICGVAAMGRAGTGMLAWLPSLVGAGAGVIALRAMVETLRTPAALPDADEDSTGAAPAQHGYATPDRREFMRSATIVGVVAAASAIAGAIIGAARSTAQMARDLLDLPAPATPAPPLPEGVQSATAGVGPFVTPNEDFYRIDTALIVPDVDPATWTLRVHGLVENEIELNLDDILARDLVETRVTLTCVSNPVGGDLVGNALWLGLPIREVLAEAVPTADADMVLSRSVDGFTASTPIEALTDDRDAIFAVAMNGEPLPVEHGFPVRMVVPGLYGYVSATKWVVDLEVTRFADASAYWTERGWSERGPIKTASRIEVPRASAHVPAGEVAVGGTAWAQHRGITKVEVQVDDGPWEEATLADEATVDTWRQWSWTWGDAEPGQHTLRCRASDPDGVQTATVAPVVPDGASGWHTIYVYVD